MSVTASLCWQKGEETDEKTSDVGDDDATAQKCLHVIRQYVNICDEVLFKLNSCTTYGKPVSKSACCTIRSTSVLSSSIRTSSRCSCGGRSGEGADEAASIRARLLAGSIIVSVRDRDSGAAETEEERHKICFRR